MKNGKVSVCEYQLYYEIYGNGENVLLLIPGALGTINTDYRPLIEELKNEKSLTIVAVDPPGYGQSSPPFKDFRLGFQIYSIAAFSDGGRIALIMAANYPLNVCKVVAWSTSSYFTSHEREYIGSILSNICNWHEVRIKALKEVYGDYLQEYWRLFINAILEYEDIFTNDLKLIQCPVLMMHGDKDPVIDKNHADFIAQRVKGAKVHHFTDGGHLIHTRFTQQFRKLIVEFVSN
ncbi:hypothetical protein B4U80_08377 [Leptotrombidium deliense]|uniref:AB hydrolase-1 domain-containing protein n=1 Tax=Leptotrombidium deliense TaxID=299467 RepID=A0A443SSZ4_9ACAR|nr:hypothetical protein B4U80_08377 [Leptotrombidium deliense]